MDKKEFDFISGLFTGHMAAMIQLSNILDAKGLVSKSEISLSFKKTAEKFSKQGLNHGSIEMVLNQIAAALEDHDNSPDTDNDPNRSLLRLIKG